MTEDVFGILGTTEDGTFRVEEAVAEGGFSIVYRAEHLLFGAPVALKCLKTPETLSAEDRAIFFRRFREEAQLLFQLSASLPEVVRPLHVGKLSLADRFVPYIVLEWLEGEPLDAMLARRREPGQTPLSVIKLVKLLTPVARALSRAHRFASKRGTVSVIHRDIKPENIFVCDRGGEQSVKLLDFGIATVMRLAGEDMKAHHPGDSFYAFTPSYGAPEQWAPARFGATTPATDVWGLAITMVEALAGRRPVDGPVDEMRATVLDTQRRPTPRALGVAVSEEVERVFAGALALDPQERTASIDELWSALERAVHLTPSLRCDARRDASTVSLPRLPPLPADLRTPITSTPPARPMPSRSAPPARPMPSRSTPPARPMPSRSAPPARPSPLTPAPPARRTLAVGSVPITADPMRVVAPADASHADPAMPVAAVTAAEIPALRVPALPRAVGVDRPARAEPVTSEVVLVADAASPRRGPQPALQLDVGPASSTRAPQPVLELDLTPAPGRPRSSPSRAPSSRPDATPSTARASSSSPGAHPSSPAMPWSDRPLEPRSNDATRPTLRLPVTLIVTAALVCGGDILLRWLSGTATMLGPVRLAHMAVVLLLVGTALFFWRVFGTGREDLEAPSPVAHRR